MNLRKGVSVVAVLLGAATDIGGSMVYGLAFGVIVGFVLAAQGVPLPQIQAVAESTIGSFLMVNTIVGFAFTVLGGFVAGRVSSRREVLHGGLVGACGLLLGLLAQFSSVVMPLWFQIVAIIATIPCGMAGGALAKRYRQRRVLNDATQQGDSWPAKAEPLSGNPYASPTS